MEAMGKAGFFLAVFCHCARGQAGTTGSPPPRPTTTTAIPLPDRCAFSLPRDENEFIASLNSKEISITWRRYRPQFPEIFP